MISAEQRALISDFAKSRCVMVLLPTTPTAEAYDAYTAFCHLAGALAVSRVDFVAGLRAEGLTFQKDKLGAGLWHLRILEDNEDAIEASISGDPRKLKIRQQLEALRDDAYSRALTLAARGKTTQANDTVRTYIKLLEAERNEFPINRNVPDAADLAIPDMDPELEAPASTVLN